MIWYCFIITLITTYVYTYKVNIFCLDKTKIKENELVIALKLNKLMLNKDENLKMFDFIKDKMSKDNVLTFYSVAKLYKLGIISESSLLYIERCFPMVIETQKFLHLDFTNLAKILQVLN